LLLSLADALRCPEGTYPKEEHDGSEESRKAESERVACLSVPGSQVFYGVSKEQKREEKENPANRLVPDDTCGPHYLWDNMGRELPCMLDFYRFCGPYNVSEFQKD
jgi:hypothetical protein